MQPDAKLLVDGYAHRQWETCIGATADLWVEIGRELELRPGSIVLPKVTAHGDLDRALAGLDDLMD